MVNRNATGASATPSGSVTLTLPSSTEYFTLLPPSTSVIFPVGTLPSHSIVPGSDSPSLRARMAYSVRPSLEAVNHVSPSRYRFVVRVP